MPVLKDPLPALVAMVTGTNLAALDKALDWIHSHRSYEVKTREMHFIGEAVKRAIDEIKKVL